MELFEAIRGRRSSRIFIDRHVKDAKIAKVIDAARWAPSACNEQAWEFVVVRDPQMKERLVSRAGSSTFLRKSPVIIYVLYHGEITSENHANIQSASAAVQNMVLAAHALGLGSVWVCDCGDRKKVRSLLKIPKNFTVICAVALGYPKERPKPPARRDLKDIMHDENFGTGPAYASSFPSDWNEKSIMIQRENGIRAKSPTPDSFPPRFAKEFEKEVSFISDALKGSSDVLDTLSFSGTHLLSVARRSGARKIYVHETSGQIADFIEKKRRSMKIGCELKFGISSLYRIPYEDSTFDTVMCIKKLETLPEPEKLITEVRRVLRPGGRLVLSFWNNRSVYGLNHFIKTNVLGNRKIQSNEGPVRPISPANARSLLEKSGFIVYGAYGINLLPGRLESFTTKGMMKQICRTMIFECRKAQ